VWDGVLEWEKMRTRFAALLHVGGHRNRHVTLSRISFFLGRQS
jgi:hypothetical protein